MIFPIRDHIKDAIKSAEGYITEGLFLNGQVRLPIVTVSQATPPKKFPYICITSGNTSYPIRDSNASLYTDPASIPIDIIIIVEAKAQREEENAYELSSQVSDTISYRVMETIREKMPKNSWVQVDQFKYKLSSDIAIEPSSLSYEAASQIVITNISNVTFTVEGC